MHARYEPFIRNGPKRALEAVTLGSRPQNPLGIRATCLSIPSIMKKHAAKIAIGVLLLGSALAAQAQWPARFNDPDNLNETQGGAFLDPDGNIVTIFTSEKAGQGENFQVVKYDRNANIIWSQIYNGPTNLDDEPQGGTVDAQGNVYVTGTTKLANGKTDVITVKYNNAGALQWTKRFDGDTHGSDDPYFLAVDGSGNVAVTGETIDTTTGSDIFTVLYDSSGNVVWKKTLSSDGNNYDYGQTVGFGPDGSVIVGANVSVNGTPYQDMEVIKYSGNGVKLWTKKYDGAAHMNDLLTSLKVDASGNVYVIGGTATANFTLDMITIKYDGNGNRQWVAKQGSSTDSDFPLAMTLDNSGNVLVTGLTGVGNKTDYVTVKYDALGNKQWVKKYNSNTSTKSADVAFAISTDNLGNVYVSGTTQGDGTRHDNNITTIKYSVDGQLRSVDTYDSPTHKDDEGGGIAVDPNRYRVYVVGLTVSLDGTNKDVIILRY